MPVYYREEKSALFIGSGPQFVSISRVPLDVESHQASDRVNFERVSFEFVIKDPVLISREFRIYLSKLFGHYDLPMPMTYRPIHTGNRLMDAMNDVHFF